MLHKRIMWKNVIKIAWLSIFINAQSCIERKDCPKTCTDYKQCYNSKDNPKTGHTVCILNQISSNKYGPDGQCGTFLGNTVVVCDNNGESNCHYVERPSSINLKIIKNAKKVNNEAINHEAPLIVSPHDNQIQVIPAPISSSSYVELHNQKRRMFTGLKNSPDLIRDPYLEQTANDWASYLASKSFNKKNELIHGGNHGAGQNLWKGTSGLYSDVLYSWVDNERNSYEGQGIGERSPTAECLHGSKTEQCVFEDYGHYTQIINTMVKKVGCSSEGGHKSEFDQQSLIVCHYDYLQVTGSKAVTH